MMTRDVVTYREFCNPDLCGQTISGFTFPPLSSYPSMLDNVIEWGSSGKTAVIEYMTDKVHLRGASTSTLKTDVFTGERIGYTGDVYMDDAGFKWPDYLVYYVDVYNVALPDEFVSHILNSAR